MRVRVRARVRVRLREAPQLLQLQPRGAVPATGAHSSSDVNRSSAVKRQLLRQIILVVEPNVRFACINQPFTFPIVCQPYFVSVSQGSMMCGRGAGGWMNVVLPCKVLPQRSGQDMRYGCRCLPVPCLFSTHALPPRLSAAASDGGRRGCGRGHHFSL
eukprot:gene11723-biopygen12432